MAKRIQQNKTAGEYHDLFAPAQKSHSKKLWNGEYFRYDTRSEYKDDIQTDQPAGQWYATATGLGDIVPKDMQTSAMKKVFNFNLMKFNNGEFGAVNGIPADGQIITTNEQVQEVWAGTRLLRPRLCCRTDCGTKATKRLGTLISGVRQEGLLVPHAGGLGSQWDVSCTDVHAQGRNIGPLRCLAQTRNDSELQKITRQT